MEFKYDSKPGFWDIFRDNVELSQNGYDFKHILRYLWQWITDHKLLRRRIEREQEKRRDLERRKQTAQQPVSDNMAYTVRYGLQPGYEVRPEIKEAIPKGRIELQKTIDNVATETDSTCTSLSFYQDGIDQRENAMSLLRRGGSSFFLKNRRHGAVIVVRSTTYNDVVKAYDMAEWEIKQPD
jgi:hypothetical protein